MSEYVWSTDDEIFRSDTFDTVEAALADADEYFGGEQDSVFVGKKEAYTFSLSADDICGRLCEQAYDEVGEVCEDWLTDMDAEQEKELSKLLTDTALEFFKDHALSPTFFKVVNVESHSLPKATP